MPFRRRSIRYSGSRSRWASAVRRSTSVSLLCLALVATACTTSPEAEEDSSSFRKSGWTPVADFPMEPLFQPTVAAIDDSVLVWGTTDPERSEPEARFAIYDPDADRWDQLQPGPLSARFGHVSVWTGRELIVWGGGPRGGLAGDGARFSLVTGEWDEMDPGPLGPRSFNTAVWTGAEMLVWGVGAEGSAAGAAYSPEGDSWRVIAEPPVQARGGHSAVWTGKEMLVWGGVRVRDTSQKVLSDGAAYDPEDDSWRRLAESPLSQRVGHSAVWTGSEMIVWGGGDPPDVHGDGAAYDPSSNSWRTLPDSPMESRIGHAAVWSGDRMFVWGGTSTVAFEDGAVFDPRSGDWSELPDAPLEGRAFPSAAWTNQGMLIWGGAAEDRALRADGAIFRP